MKCPYCSENIKDDALKCRYCGEWISEPRREASALKSASESPSKAPSESTEGFQSLEADSPNKSPQVTQAQLPLIDPNTQAANVDSQRVKRGLPPSYYRSSILSPMDYAESYLIWSILAAALCFPPTGIAAISYSLKVRRLLAEGMPGLALTASKRAKLLCIMSLVIAIIFVYPVLLIVF